MIMCLFGHRHRHDFKVVEVTKNSGMLQIEFGAAPAYAIVQGTCSRCGVAFEKTYDLEGMQARIMFKHFEKRE